MTAVASYVVHNRTKFNRLGLWLFLITEVAMFGSFLVMRFYYWGNTRPDLDQTIGLIVTSILLISSFFMNRAEVAIAHNDRLNYFVSLLITGALGTAFLLGVVFIEWGLALPPAERHLTPQSGLYGSILFLMTGMHALHVLTGLIFILAILINGLRNKYTAESHWAVEFCAVYWHFVDVVWVFFYPALYLIGHATHL